MTTRWWHHDDRNSAPARTAYDSNASSNNYRQQPAQQQYAIQTHSPMRQEAPEFEPTPQPAPAAAQAAPGFNRTGPAVAKAQLPKCWEYEDPLKDVHGPFDAGQIINWFAQDWFGTDLKIRRIGQYWTMLEYVLEELKAEARGTSAPSSTYTTAPQQVPQAATTPAASYGTQRSTPVTAPTATYGRSAAAPAPVAAGGIEQWGPNSSTASYPAAATTAAEDTWGPAVGPSSRSDRMMDRGFGSSVAAAAAPAAVQARPRGRGAEDYRNSGGFGSEDYSGVRGRGARDKEREAVAAAAAGVQYGTDGKWERGYVIEGENRRGARNSRSYQDYDSYGDEYGSSSRRGRGRASRPDRGADRYGEGRETGAGYDRATKILDGTEDDEYGGSARSRGRAVREGRGAGQGSGGSGGFGVSSADVWPGGSRDSKQEPDAWPGSSTAREPAAAAAKASRSKRDSKAAAASKDSTYPKPGDSKAAAAVAAATAALGSIGLSGAGSGSLAPAAPAVDANVDGWGNIAADPVAATIAEGDGWGSTKAKPLRGKWGDEPVDSDSPTADELTAGPPATASAAEAEGENSSVQPQPAADTVAENKTAESQSQPAAAASGEGNSSGQSENSAAAAGEPHSIGIAAQPHTPAASGEAHSADIDVQPRTAALTAGGKEEEADPVHAAAAAGGLAEHAAAERIEPPADVTAGDVESKYLPPAAESDLPMAHAAVQQAEPVSANSTAAAAQPEADSKPEYQAQALAAPAEAPPTADSEEQPKLSKVQQLIKMQEQQLQQQAAGKSTHSPGRSATPPPGRSATPPRNPLRNSASAGSLTGQAGANGTASPTGAAAAAAEHTAAGTSEDDKDISSSEAVFEHTAAAPAADHEADLAGFRSAGAADAGSTVLGGGGKTVAGITAGIFSRVAGALMGSGSSSSTSEERFVERGDADVE